MKASKGGIHHGRSIQVSRMDGSNELRFALPWRESPLLYDFLQLRLSRLSAVASRAFDLISRCHCGAGRCEATYRVASAPAPSARLFLSGAGLPTWIDLPGRGRSPGSLLPGAGPSTGAAPLGGNSRAVDVREQRPGRRIMLALGLAWLYLPIRSCRAGTTLCPSLSLRGRARRRG
jgi:hypothetical protein